MTFLREETGTSELLRRVGPSLTVLLGAILMALPFPLAWSVMPNLALLGVIIWASIQPRLMPSWAALLLGLFADLLFGGPIGVWTLIFPLSGVAVKLGEARVEGHSLAMDWTFAGILMMAAHLLAWQVNAFVGNDSPLLPWVAQAIMGILAYPLAAWFAARVQRQLVDSDN